jgi:hypothetical protein
MYSTPPVTSDLSFYFYFCNLKDLECSFNLVFVVVVVVVVVVDSLNNNEQNI